MLTVLKDSQVKEIKAPTTLGNPMSGNKVFFISLGCPRNLVDTEVMIGILLKAGYEAAIALDEADFIVINTCGFLESSRQESLDTIGEALSSRKKGAKVIATGCMVQTHSDQVKEKFPEIHYLLGSGDVTQILTAVESAGSGDCVSSAKSFIEMGEVPRTLSTPKHYAYLKIAEGCRKACAFCKIPTIKGRLKSKPLEQIQKELRILLDSGVKEVILIAQDLGDWGKDLGFKLEPMLKELLENEKRSFSLRLLYLYPDEISDELIQLIKSDKRICHYLDMPIQHANDTILKAMRRATNKKDIVDTIQKLRKEIPDIVIRTSLMVGFPGETAEQFEELCQFIQDSPLDNIGIFTFSLEEGTHAATLPDQVPEHVKQKRHKKLATLQQKIVEKRNKKMIGKVLDVVVESYHPESKLLMIGRHYGQCPEIDGCVLINDARKVKAFGETYKVEITDCTDYDLIGKVL
jgi:ribosomal protein S12 methylthiotransferase